ncbi:hypothetical protein, partial [Escherichia albertii]|uniref:hypothetical protein n=1 Tax=Escherichia albertii TaxID=208962 RepID=UPI001F1CC9C6
HMYESVSLSASFLNPIFALSVFLHQARTESFVKVSPPDKSSPVFWTALPALFIVSCKPRFLRIASVSSERYFFPLLATIAG